MRGLMALAGEKTEERSITITTYSVGPDKVIMEGTLIDRHFRENYLLTGEKRPVGVFHHLVLRLLIDAANRRIEDVDVDLVKVPRDACVNIKSSLDPLKGEQITRGFLRRMQTLIRKDVSCAHLRALLMAMAATAVQGIYSIQSQRPLDLSLVIHNPELERAVLGTTMNTCYVWRENGPEFQQLLSLIENERRKGTK